MKRRTFLAGAAGAALLRPERILGANDRVRIGVCGLRGRGIDHIKHFSKLPGVELAAVCDVDENVIANRLNGIEKLGLAKPKTFVDFRRMLDDREIDAVTI